MGYVVYGWCNAVNISCLKYMGIFPVIDIYIEFLIVTFYSILISVFKSRYEDLNRKLSNLLFDKNFDQEIKNLRKYYRILGEAFDVFNKVFGNQVVLIFVSCGLQVVEALNGCYILFHFFTKNGRFYHLLLSCLWFFIYIVVKSY